MIFIHVFTFILPLHDKMKTNKQGKKSTRTTRRLGSVKIKLRKETFETMVFDILKTVYGTGPHGQLRYSINDEGIQSLKQGSELFLEQMWKQLTHIVRKNHTHTITSRHVQLWKQTNGFKQRFKPNDMSLCKLFKSV